MMANPYRCLKCHQASFAASTDPGGLCPWCRRETDKDRLLVSAMDRVAPPRTEGGEWP